MLLLKALTCLLATRHLPLRMSLGPLRLAENPLGEAAIQESAVADSRRRSMFLTAALSLVLNTVGAEGASASEAHESP